MPSSSLGSKDDALWRILTSSKHDSLAEAILADLIDALPIIGDITNLLRVMDAIERKDDLVLALQAGDLLGGLPPIIGEIFDILSPTNTIAYIMRKR
ncbi:MAG: hypothetical protein J7K15_12925 [Deltaproteobacteria bacterium]|nr:hypothetical protein [Deltaproteobacteria bacterium]